MSLPASLHVTDALYGLAIGMVAVVATFGVCAVVRRPRWSLVVGLAAASIAGILAMYAARAVGYRIVDDIDTPTALGMLAVGALAGTGWSVLHRDLGLGWTTAIVLVTAAGVWAAVPDTETAVVVLAAWLPFAAAVAVLPRTSPRRAKLASRGTTCVAGDANFARVPRGARVAGWAALAAVLTWAAAWGSDAKVEARPGAVACFGVAIVAVGLLVARRPRPAASSVLAVQAVTVVVASRWVAPAATVTAGLVRAAVVLVVAATALVVLSARRGAPAPPPPSDPAARPR